MSIENRFAYVVGLNLQQKHIDFGANLKLKRVYAEQSNYRNALFATLTNTTPMFINQVSTQMKVYKQSDLKKVIYTQKTTNQAIAPNSSFDYTYRLGDGKSFEAGKYHYVLDVTSNEGKWHFEKDFTISQKEANRLNKKDLTIENKGIEIWQIVLIIAAIVILLFFIILVKRRKKKEREELKAELLLEIEKEQGIEK